MRILHTADWHLGRTLEGRSRLPEQEAFFDELVSIADDQQVDAILMAGDVFDTVNPPAHAELLFYDALARLAQNGKRPVICIAGNHDHPQRLAASVPIAEQHGVWICGLPREEAWRIPIPAADTSLHVAALPYPSESRLTELLAEEQDDEALQLAYDERVRQLFATLSRHAPTDAISVAVSHLFVAGGKESDSERPIQLGGAYTVRPTSLPDNVSYTALGHLHRAQVVHGAPRPSRYAGSPIAYSFSEANHVKSVSIVDIAHPQAEAVVQEIPLSSGKPLVCWQATEGLPQVQRWIDEGRDRQAWIDLEIDCTDALAMEDIHHLRKSHPGFIHIRPRFIGERMDIESGVDRQTLSVPDLFEKFYAQQTGGAQADEALVRTFMELVQETETEKD